MNGMNMSDLMGILNSPDGLKQMMQRPAFEDDQNEHEFSQADLIADVINIMRMDTKRIAEAHDVEVEISMMTPDRAAELLQGVAKGEDLGLIEIFDAIEDKRMSVLEELEGTEAMVEYQEMKQQHLFTVPDDAATPLPEGHDDNE